MCRYCKRQEEKGGRVNDRRLEAILLDGFLIGHFSFFSFFSLVTALTQPLRKFINWDFQRVHFGVILLPQMSQINRLWGAFRLVF